MAMRKLGLLEEAFFLQMLMLRLKDRPEAQT